MGMAPRAPLAAVAHATSGQPKTLGDHILLLRDGGFFSQPKIEKEVYEKVHETYYCERKRIGVELFRLYSKKHQLRKASKVVDGKKLVAYVW